MRQCKWCTRPRWRCDLRLWLVKNRILWRLEQYLP